MAFLFNGTSDYLEEISGDFASMPLTAAARYLNTTSNFGCEVSFCNAVDAASLNLKRTGSSTLRINEINAAGTSGNATATSASGNVGCCTVGRWNNHASRDIFANSVAITSNTTNITGTLTAPDRIRIGAGSGAAGIVTDFDGVTIMQVAVWNVALTDDECIALARAKAPFHLIRPENQIRLYDLLDLNDKRGQHSLTAFSGAARVSTLSRPMFPHKSNREMNGP